MDQNLFAPEGMTLDQFVEAVAENLDAHEALAQCFDAIEGVFETLGMDARPGLAALRNAASDVIAHDVGQAFASGRNAGYEEGYSLGVSDGVQMGREEALDGLE